jgi:hypothetical protein
MEARLLLAAGILMTAGALVWLLGPWGLLASGVVLTAIALFLVDVKERARAEAVEDPAWSQRGGPVRR